MVNERIRVMTG
jgi:hypothetical protein